MSMTTYTPTSSDIVHTTQADLVLRPVQNVVHITQYDSNLPLIEVELYRNGEAYVVPSNADVWIRWGKKDHTYTRKLAMISEDRTKVYFRVTYNMAYFDGNINPILVLSNDNSVAGSSSIPVVIDPNPIQYPDGPSAPEDEILEEIKNLSNGIPIEINLGSISTSGDLYLNLFNALTTYILENDLEDLFAKYLGEGEYKAISSVMRVCYNSNSDIIVISAYNLSGDVGFGCSVEFICSRVGIKTDSIRYYRDATYPNGHFDTITGYEEIYGGGGTVDLPLERGSATNSLKQTAAGASGVNSSAFGTSNASGERAHAEGNACVASGNQSHAEGSQSQASANQAHAEGYGCHATGNGAHAENDETVAAGPYSHTEGESTQTTQAAKYAHAGGNASIAEHEGAFLHGMGLKSNSNYGAVFGNYNKVDSSYLFSVGIGTDNSHRKNIFSITSTTVIVDGFLVVNKPNTINSGKNEAVTMEWIDYMQKSIIELASALNKYLIKFKYLNGYGTYDTNNFQYSVDNGITWYNVPRTNDVRIGYYVNIGATIKFRIRGGGAASRSGKISKSNSTSSSQILALISSSSTTEYTESQSIDLSTLVTASDGTKELYLGEDAFY